MAFLLHVEFNASSETVASQMLEYLSRMADLVQRDHPKVYTYAFRHDIESKKKLLFTELYADEEVFLAHSSDPEFVKLYQQAFTPTAGRSGKELCIRSDLSTSFSPITANILDHYLHVTYLPIEHGFLHRNVTDRSEGAILMVCTGCETAVYEQFNALFNCVTCISFQQSEGDRQLLAVIAGTSDQTASRSAHPKPSIDTIELVSAQNEVTIQTLQDRLKTYFQIQSFRIQTSFSGYIHHTPSA